MLFFAFYNTIISMLYPEFIKQKQTIGICAPSAGVGHKLDRFLVSKKVLASKGYKIKETASVRRNNVRSTSGKKRAKELNELVVDKKIKFILCAAGGDFMLEMMPYVDFEAIKNNPKWIAGMSDPTNLLYTVTTKLDIATLYGQNGSGFVFEKAKPQETFLKYMEGKILKQNSYKKYRNMIEIVTDDFTYHDVKWICKENNINIQGRLIGGCLECIRQLIGTNLDYTNDFIQRYKEDGIVWYFDIFDMSSYNFYLTLLQFKNAGWFDYCKGVLISRVGFPKIENKNLDYIKAADKVLKNIPHIMEMDIGHTDSAMTLINGALINVDYKDNKGSISFKLK